MDDKDKRNERNTIEKTGKVSNGEKVGKRRCRTGRGPITDWTDANHIVDCQPSVALRTKVEVSSCNKPA